jgi:hypothetical protein
VFRFIRPPLAVVGNETVAEDTLADGEKKAVAVADLEVELADVEGAPAERTSWSSMQPSSWFSCSFFFFNLLAHQPCSDIFTGCSTLCDQELLVKCSCCCSPVPIKQYCHSCLPSGRCFNAWNRHVKPFLCTNKYSSCSLKIEVPKLAIVKNPCV